MIGLLSPPGLVGAQASSGSLGPTFPCRANSLLVPGCPLIARIFLPMAPHVFCAPIGPLHDPSFDPHWPGRAFVSPARRYAPLVGCPESFPERPFRLLFSWIYSLSPVLVGVFLSPPPRVQEMVLFAAPSLYYLNLRMFVFDSSRDEPLVFGFLHSSYRPPSLLPPEVFPSSACGACPV